MDSSKPETTNNSSAADLMVLKDVLWYSPTECRSIMAGFGFFGVVGSLFHGVVLLVLINKMKREPLKSASDLFFIFLASTDLTACAILFPLEFLHFSPTDCNKMESNLHFGLISFLEVLSTLSLQSIAVNRFLLVWKSNQILINYRRSLLFCLVNLLLSFVIVLFILTFGTKLELIFHLYTYFIFSNLAVMILIYLSIFVKLCHRVQIQRRNRSAELQSGNGQKKYSYEQKKSLEAQSNSSAQRPTTMEIMRNRSAVISVVVTAVYMLCFLPNGTLSLVIIMKPEILTEAKPDSFVAYCTKYLQLFYNLNFVLMPLLYAVMSQQFRKDFQLLLNKFRRNSGRCCGYREAGCGGNDGRVKKSADRITFTQPITQPKLSGVTLQTQNFETNV